MLGGVERFCRAQTEGFRLDKIHSDFVYVQKAEGGNEELLKLLLQKFTFLGSGVQSYAFLGEDGKTVLKVFKHYHNLPVKGWLKTVPLPSFLEDYRASILKKREHRLHSIFSSCELAYQELKEETGLIYLHLGKIEDILPTISVRDKIGIFHEIDLNHTAFVLQEKVEMLIPKLDALVKQGEVEKAQACVRSLKELIMRRCTKGVANGDLRIERNIGFAGERAVEIDIGSYNKKPHKKRTTPYEKEISKLHRWMRAHYPQIVDEKDL